MVGLVAGMIVPAAATAADNGRAKSSRGSRACTTTDVVAVVAFRRE